MSSLICHDRWYSGPVPPFTIWNRSFTRLSLVCKIDWDRRSASDLISVVECFQPLTVSQFGKSPTIEHVCSTKMFRAIDWALSWSHPSICFLTLMDLAKAKLWLFSGILGQNYDLSFLFFLVILDHRVMMLVSTIPTVVRFYLRESLSP